MNAIRRIFRWLHTTRIVLANLSLILLTAIGGMVLHSYLRCDKIAASIKSLSIEMVSSRGFLEIRGTLYRNPFSRRPARGPIYVSSDSTHITYHWQYFVEMDVTSWRQRAQRSVGLYSPQYPSNSPPGSGSNQYFAAILPYWLLVTLVLTPSCIAAAARAIRRRARRRRGLCIDCGYDCRFSPERCPECGKSRIPC